jgi:hypothetical protein
VEVAEGAIADGGSLAAAAAGADVSADVLWHGFSCWAPPPRVSPQVSDFGRKWFGI